MHNRLHRGSGKSTHVTTFAFSFVVWWKICVAGNVGKVPFISRV